MFPAEYNMSIINAQHGSWDRNPPLGYRLAVLNLGEDGLAQNYSILADGWLQPNNTAWGRLLLPHVHLCTSNVLLLPHVHLCTSNVQICKDKCMMALSRTTCCWPMTDASPNALHGLAAVLVPGPAVLCALHCS